MPFDPPGEMPSVTSPTPGPKLDLDNYIPFGLTAIANRLARGASREYLRMFGIGINEWRVLAYVRVFPETTANQMCQHSSLDKAAVSRSLHRLIESGLIESRNDAGDARGRHLRLTKDGMAMHDRVIHLALDRERRVLTGFSSHEKGLLLSFIARMQANAAWMQDELDD